VDGIEVIDRKSELHTDMPIMQVKKLDAMLRLFDGDVSLTELVHMDLPSQRAWVHSRIDNLRESQEKYKKGIIDSFSISNRYTSSLGGHSLNQTGTVNTDPPQIERPKSRNARVMYQDQH
jgi:hypothetical protein